MKLVVAVLKPFKLDDVKNVLKNMGVAGMTLTEAQGFGRQRGHTENYRGAEYQVDFVPKLRLEVLAEDDRAAAVVDATVSPAGAGASGRGPPREDGGSGPHRRAGGRRRLNLRRADKRARGKARGYCLRHEHR